MELPSWFHTFRHFFSASLIWNRIKSSGHEENDPAGFPHRLGRRPWSERTHMRLRAVKHTLNYSKCHRIFSVWSEKLVTMIPSKRRSFGVRMVPFASLIIGFVLWDIFLGRKPAISGKNNNYWIFREHWQAGHPAEVLCLKGTPLLLRPRTFQPCQR